MTLDETIKLMLDLNKNQPIGRKFPVGLYIETKMYGFYKTNYGIDSAQLLFYKLKEYSLETIDKSKDVLPIIVECFELPSLQKFSTLSDLPLIYLTKESEDTLLIKLPEVAKTAHGVGPKASLVVDSPAVVNLSKSLQLDIHPWTVRDD